MHLLCGWLLPDDDTLVRFIHVVGIIVDRSFSFSLHCLPSHNLVIHSIVAEFWMLPVAAFGCHE